MSQSEENKDLAAETMLRIVTSLLRWASRLETREALRGSGPIDPTSPRGWILARLDENDAIRVTDIAAWLSVDKSTITPQVAALESLGLLTRSPDPSDGRAQQIVITTKGRRAHRATLRNGQRIFSEMLSEWTEEDLAALTRVGRLFGASLDERANQVRPIRDPRNTSNG